MPVADQDEIKLPHGFTLKKDTSSPQAGASPQVKLPQGFVLKGQKDAAPPPPQGFSLTKESTAGTPQQKIYDATIAEGQSPERAWKRVHEYDYGIKQGGMNPDRAQQFAMNLRWSDTPAKVLTPEEKQNILQSYSAMSPEERVRQGVAVEPQQFVDGYAEAKARGMSEEDSIDYGNATPVMRATMRAEQWGAPKWGNFKAGVLRVLGADDKISHVTTKEAAESPLVATISGQTGQDYAFNTYKDASWVDKHFGKVAGEIQSHWDNLVAGLTTPDMAAIEIASGGSGILEGALPEVGESASVAAKATRFTQKTIRTTSQLAHAGFTAQMATGSGQSFGAAWNAGKEGNVSEAIGYTLDGLVNGLMAYGGERSIEAHHEILNALDDKTSSIYPDKKFSQLSDKQQGLMIQKLIDDDPRFKQAADSSERQMQRQVKALHRRYSEGLQGAWNPNAAHRAITDLRAERAETARKEQIQKVVDTLKAKVQQRTSELRIEAEENQDWDTERRRKANKERGRAEVERREQIQQTAEQIARGREETLSNRQALSEIPTEEQTSRPVDADVDDAGHVTYPVQYWGETNHFGVATDGERHSVYRRTERGVEWLDRSGNFTDTPESLYFNADPETSGTVAKLSSLKLGADGLAAQPGATADQIKDAETLGEIRRGLIDGEITAADARKQAGIADKVRLPDVDMAAREGRLSGPFSEKSAVEYESEVESMLRDSNAGEEEIQATLESLPEQARVNVESNLHHVSQPGDYIVSKKGVKWTLDANGLLHSSDGEVMPLMKRGTYSNQAMQIAASGRVGYGSKTRLERRADFARNRDIKRQIQIRQDEFDREMRIAQQNAGLENASVIDPSAREGERGERAAKFAGRIPPPPEVVKARQERRAAYKASADPDSIINQLAKQFNVTPDEVMRVGLSESQPNTAEGKAASLEVGDRVSDPFKPDRPWIVEEKNGQLFLRSGQSNPLPFDRLNPSPRALQILERGDITHDRDWTDTEKEKVAFEKPYLVHQKLLVDGVKDRMEGKVRDPEPKTQAQAEVQAVAAENRKEAAHSEAVKAASAAVNPEVKKDDTPEKASERADDLARKAEEAKKLAKEATAQSAEARAKTGKKGQFPQRSPISIKLKGDRTTIDQNNRQIAAHYELVPVGAVITSHTWDGERLVRTPDDLFPKELQPREPNERTVFQRRLDAQQFAVSADGKTSGYNFAKYSNKTIDALSGPPLVEPGGRTVSGNGRLQRLLKHVHVLNEIADPEERAVAVEGLKSGMRKLAKDSGIGHYPEDGQLYIVVRMMDEPIKTLEEATKLGLLFNESEADNISDSQKGLVYGRSFDQDLINKIGRMVEESEGGLPAAMRKNPFFFAQLAADKFDIPTSQQSAWFAKDEEGNDILTDQGQRLFQRAMNGYVIEDPDLLSGIENEVAYKAFTNAIGYVARLKVFPELDLTEKIKEALQAARLTAKAIPDVITKDVWDTVYQPNQIDLATMERELPAEPDRVTESLWRALHASDSASPRTFSDRMKRWISDEETQNSMFPTTKSALEKPSEKFNRVFASELKEVALRRNRGTDKRGTTDGWMLTQNDYDAALRGQDLSDEERHEKPEVKAEAKPAETPKLGPPPKAETADRKLSEEKGAQGYVTPQRLREFLETNPVTRDHASELMRTAQMIAEHVYEADPPEGVDKKQALEWILQKRLGTIEEGSRKGVRGQYVDPRLEKGLANGILRLHKAADATSFIHEFAHVVFPMLSDKDLKAIDTIGEKRVWDGTRGNLNGETYAALSEKLAHGMERFLRDQNPRDFSAEVGKVLAKVKDIFRRVYLAFKGDPLSPYTLGSDSIELFDKMFHIEGSNLPDIWREEVSKARAAEKKIVRPEEEPHPIVKLARELGGNGIRESIGGRPTYMFGDRVDPRKPIVTISFPSEAAVDLAVARLATGKDKIGGGEVIKGDDGTWALKINTTAKPPKGSLFQGLPERDLGLQLEDLEKRLKETPSYKTFERRFVQDHIDRLKVRIRREVGLDEPEPQRDPELPKKVLEEVKNAKAADRGRDANDGIPGIPKPPRVGGIPQPPKLGVSGHAGSERGRPTARGGVSRAPIVLENVKPVTLEPLTGVRGDPVGTVRGEKFDQKAWVEGLKKAGLPESTPAPTYALDPKTAAQLIYPGQKQVVQTVMSALEQGDGVAVVTPAGTGKSYTSTATIKEFLRGKPDARVLLISKNRGLLKKSKRVAANTFGFDMELDTPEGQPGVYGASYIGLLNNSIYKNSKWDLVVADESGEARRWYDEDTKQGQMLRDVMENSRKGVYLSATPFHSPMEYGYLDKLNLWPKGQFDRWIQGNFAHEKIGDKIIARLDPGKQAKLREQLIERGQFVSQAISYDGYNAHFGVVPVTDSMKRGLDRIREGFERARHELTRQGKPGLAKKAAAFEAVYTKNFLERERLPQAIELAKKAREQGWRVLFFSEHTADDLFRRERQEGEEASTYQQLDDAMGGQLSRIIPPYPSIYNELYAEFGNQIGDYSGKGNTEAAREEARTKFLKGENSMLYASYAGGGIGVDMHDADYPELNVKGGERPIVAIYLGPPYSGVLLEQAMGRPWRFGVKSDVHAVFLATDSEPDIRLMQTKVGPRMKALRAAVLGEKDSLANVMSTYTDEEKVRERQDQLAYAEGNEVKVNATQFQVRSKQRSVGIQDWSAISFPSAEEAKNRGMKYGEAVTGGDWSSLYQSKFELRPPDPPENVRAKDEINKIANGVASGRAVPGELQNLDPAQVKDAVGLSSATATAETGLPLDRDKTNTARQSMDSQLRSGRPFPYYGLILSQELGMENIARHAGKPEVGKNLKLMNRNMRADYDVSRSQYWNMLEDTFKRNGVKTDDKEKVWTITRVLEGHESSADPKINAIAADLSDMMRIAHQDLSKAGVGVRDHTGKIVAYYGKDFGEDPTYYPHRIDWDQEVTDVYISKKTGEKITRKLNLREMMKEKSEEIRKRIIANIPELRPYTYEQVYEYLNRHTPKAPVLSNIHRAREINFPFIKRDYETLVGYFDQVSEATAQAKNFGPQNEKLNAEIRKIKDVNSIETLQSMFRSTLEPQNWDDITAKIYNAAVAYEAASKMTFSAVKVPFHLSLVPLGMGGKVLPLARAIGNLALHPREVMENAGYVGVLTRQLSAADIMFGERQAAPVRQILRKEMFESAYKVVRALSGESAKVYLDQYAIRDLKRGGRGADTTRRLLRDTFLIGDGSIDEAIARGRFSPEDIGRAQTAFANLTTFSDDPLQMPQLARAEIAKGENRSMIGLKRAIRLTYVLQSFSLKAMSLLREKLYDEVVIHKNYEPLAYVIVASPIIGEMLQATGAGAKHVIHKGFEGLTGHKHTQDSWDNHIANLKRTFKHPQAADLLKFIIDGYTLGYGWDMVRTVADPLLDLASGNLKKSGQGFKYMGADLLEHIAGPFYSDIAKSVEEVARIGQIEAGKGHPLQKPQKIKQSIGKYIEGQVPALRQFPPFEDAAGIKPPPR
jgi:hypothetical protein